MLKANLKYLREGMFQRLAAGQDTGNLDIAPLMECYPEFYLVMVRLEAAGRDEVLEHFIVENVFSELIEQHGDGFVVSYDRMTLIGLAAIETEDKLQGMLASMREYLSRYLKIPFRIVPSGCVQDIREVPDAVKRMSRSLAEPGRELPEKMRVKSGSDNKAIEVSLQYIHAHYKEESLSLETIASVVFLNPVYFSQLFKQKTGQGFKDYIIGLRLEEAKQLLAESDLKLADIASRIGYQDMRHFTQVFRKRLLLTPTEYRQQKRWLLNQSFLITNMMMACILVSAAAKSVIMTLKRRY